MEQPIRPANRNPRDFTRRVDIGLICCGIIGLSLITLGAIGRAEAKEKEKPPAIQPLTHEEQLEGENVQLKRSRVVDAMEKLKEQYAALYQQQQTLEAKDKEVQQAILAAHHCTEDTCLINWTTDPPRIEPKAPAAAVNQAPEPHHPESPEKK